MSHVQTTMLPESHRDLNRQLDRIDCQNRLDCQKLPKDEPAAQRLTIQVEFFKRGLHALGQWRVEHPAVPKETVVDAISALVFSGLSAQE
jgi:hypothetical protein